VLSGGMISTQKSQLYNRDTTGTVVENMYSVKQTNILTRSYPAAGGEQQPS
jgi:hypothetical protein